MLSLILAWLKTTIFSLQAPKTEASDRINTSLGKLCFCDIISNFCHCTDELHDTQMLDGSNPAIFSTYCQKYKLHSYCFISRKGLA